MADFCFQCSIEHFGKDYGDLAGFGPPPEEGMGYPAICEGCGFIYVDHEGRCIDPQCEIHGKEKTDARTG